MNTKNTDTISLSRSKTVRGYEVKRLALGGYLQAIHTLNTLPGALLGASFPGKTAGEILGVFMGADGPTLRLLIGHLGQDAPDFLFQAVSAITGIPLDTLLEDTDVDLDGIFEILQAWGELNKMADFPKDARKLSAGFREGRKLPDTEHWLQRLIVRGLRMGISKRALLEDFYPDELNFIFDEYNMMYRMDEDVEEEHVGALAFLGFSG